MNYYKYGITPAELKEARKFIIQDIKSNNEVVNPIYNMTLQDYFDIIKECMKAFIDENGVVKDMFDKTWYSEAKKQDIRNMSAIEVAKAWMDGRGLFSEHCNGQLMINETHYGNWSDIAWTEHNQWYHEDRLNNPLWFKECVSVIGHGGHPTENMMISNVNPHEYETDKWYISFGSFSRSHFGTLKAYLYLRKNTKIPAFIYSGQYYLTQTQIEKLKFEGYLITKDYQTGYMV